MRIRFDNGRALLVREHGTERKAAWWVLAPGDDGPLERLGPEPDSDEFAELILHGTDKRRIHTILRDQRTVSGIGRGYAERRAAPRARLAVRDARLALRRASAPSCSTRSARRSPTRSRASANGPAGCPSRGSASGSGCTTARARRVRNVAMGLRRVSYESYEVTYCPQCQTGGKVLADRRMSRLVK